MTHTSNAFAVRGLGSLTILQLRVCCGYVPGARFKHGKNAQRLGWTHRGAFWRSRDNKFEGELPGSLSSSIFGQIRCRKSPARGFWTF
jgi:hypothetical protein